MAGGTVQRIWGGSNGRYDFVPVGHELYNVYNYGTYDEAHPETGLIATAAKPDVDSTNVNIWGGTINASVYAGGSMADGRTTCLVVDDMVGCTANGISTGNAVINGALYGGGEGRWDDLNARDFDGNRWGNVNGSTYVHLHHAKNVTSATAYGGGSGGDVANTYIKAYPTWNNPFLAIYGGCWGSDVRGTAYLEFDGDTLVNNLFGGNGTNMFGNFLDNLVHGKVSGLSIGALIAASYLIFGRTGLLGKIGGALMAMMMVGNNSQKQTPSVAQTAENELAREQQTGLRR